MPELKTEALNHLPRSLNSFHYKAKKHFVYPVVLHATDSLLCTVLPFLAKTFSVETFFHLAKTFLVMLFSLPF